MNVVFFSSYAIGTPISEFQRKDKEAAALIRFLESGTVAELAPQLKARKEEFALAEGVLWRKCWSDKGRGQIFLPTELRRQAFVAFHDHLMGGNLGIRNTLHKIAAKYTGPRYTHTLNNGAQRERPAREGQKIIPSMQPIPITAPGQQTACDSVGPLTKTKDGNRYILVVADYCIKWAECVLLPNTKTERVAKTLIEQVICRFVVPYSLLTDQEANLTSQLMKEVCRLLGIRKLQTTAYHP